MVATGLLVLSALSTSVSAAATPAVKNQSNVSSTGSIISLGKDATTSKVLSSAAAMNSYISLGSDNLLHIDSKAKKIVGNDVYKTYELGVSRVNAEIQSGSLVVQDGTLKLGATTSSSDGGMHTNIFGNAYWWGVAVTFTNQETLDQVYTLTQTGVVWGLVAAVSGVIPGGQVAAASSAIVSAGSFLIANSMSANNRGNGVTLNIHWSPVYFESTPN
jgi:hypothetical protein